MATLLLLLSTRCSDEPPPEKARAIPECTRNGVCDDGIFCNGAERCEDRECVAGEPIACDDGVDCTTDACDEALWACRHVAPDEDSDGYADASCKDARSRPLGEDCDDADASRNPGAVEFCDPNHKDEDCDSSTVGDRDEDEDSTIAAPCCNATSTERQCGPDCDDSNSRVGPDATEVCDDVDNDCDGRVDEDVKLTLFRDGDGDGYGRGDVVIRSCAKVPGYADESEDCDDSTPAIHSGAKESCELPPVDRDCNGTENDLPGGCRCKAGTERPCPLSGLCADGVLACVNELWTAHCSIGPVGEVCNGLDDDCDGEVDDDATIDCYEDEDGDGYAAAGAVSETVCPSAEQLEKGETCPAGSTVRAPLGSAIDCDPEDRGVAPSAQELCNGKDDDCDGSADDGLPVVARFIDGDGDGHPGTAVERCAEDPLSYDLAGDCMDDNPLVHPEQGGVFTNPACGGGFAPCLASEADWRCRPAGSDACGRELSAARWDYDCDDAIIGEPFVSEPCLTGGVCADGCGSSGFLTAGVGTPSCGSAHAYQICRCLGAQGGGCTGTTEQRPYACH